MLCNGTCNARTDGLVHLPPALRNTVNAADLKRDKVLLRKAEKYTQRHYKNLPISVVLSASLALKSDSSFL